MISSRATTAPVTASRLMLAPAKEFAISAPNAGPPVTLATSESGSPSRAASRRSVTMSESANPLRFGFNPIGAMAASPSAAGISGAAGRSATPVA